MAPDPRPHPLPEISLVHAPIAAGEVGHDVQTAAGLHGQRSPGSAVEHGDEHPERLLAHALVGQGLPEPIIQYVVRDADGRLVARCDLAYPQWRIVIEYDSVQEHTGRDALLRDSARRNAITALGFTPVVATIEDLKNDARMLASVIRRIRDRAA